MRAVWQEFWNNAGIISMRQSMGKGVAPMATDCIFCKIIAREVPANIVWETEQVLVFPDMNPQAPTHLLIIPKKHIPSLLHITPDDDRMIAGIYAVVKDVATKFNLDEGFRIVTNNGALAGQTVGHLHFHLLGGRKLVWPPG